MSSSSMSLKARIRNVAKANNMSAQVLLQNYMFERFLSRLSQSEYKDQFILKGGLLIADIVGICNRSTMDMDTTLRNLKLTEDSVHAALDKICSLPTDDEIEFAIGWIVPIRADDIYGGLRVRLIAKVDRIETPLSMDITAGDAITPGAVKHTFHSIFDDKEPIELWAYNVETILAEKLETILRRNILNTRPRDYYDVVILTETQSYNARLLKQALFATAEHRGTINQISDIPNLLERISENRELLEAWQKYQRQFNYAADITWEKVMKSITSIIQNL